ncbi:MAG: hypothetical protein DCF21_03870 [Leptolyngbya sp.]|nr:MAG: hypothetical protein DCF21_03870 [Leptolyngbya sp.]
MSRKNDLFGGVAAALASESIEHDSIGGDRTVIDFISSFTHRCHRLGQSQRRQRWAQCTH